MRLTRFLVAVALVLALPGCKHAGERLEGHWHGVRAEGIATDQQVAANAFAVGTELEFKSGTLRVKTPSNEQTGKYKVTTEDKQSVTVTTDRDGVTDPQTFYFPDERTMRWQVLEGKAITFQKD
jgi:hypothetical protein